MRVRLRFAAAAVFCGLLALPDCLNGGFVASVSGAGAVISPPATAISVATRSDSYQIWDESSGNLAASVKVDQAGQSGNYDGLTDYSTLGTTLPSGAAYEAVMVQLNPLTQFPDQSPIASITFTNKIIGLALFGTSLNASDGNGSSTTTYPVLPSFFLQNRGIDNTHNDRFSVSADGRTLSLQLTAALGSFDQIRVFTAAANVPEPASLVLWTGICFVVAFRYRGFRRSAVYTCGR